MKCAPECLPQREKTFFQSVAVLESTMKKTTSQREKTHFSLGVAFFLL
jgi:hypothetical protein